MCHVSVGHVARGAEAEGIPTVTVMVEAFAHRAREAKIPRTLTTHFPMGRPLGAVHDRSRQRDVLEHAFGLLETARAPGTVEHYPHPWRTAPANS